MATKNNTKQLLYMHAFRDFLITHHIRQRFEKYSHYTISYNSTDSKNYLMTRGPASFVSSAFTWSDTKEGAMFWSNIYHKWNDYLIAKKIV